jgi:hypothetical protein
MATNTATNSDATGTSTPGTAGTPNVLTGEQPTNTNPANPANPSAGGTTTNLEGFYNEITGLFPWIQQLGLTPEWFHTLAAESAGPDEVIAKLRQAPQYRQRFPGLFRNDGSMRMTEAQYIGQEDTYRRLLRQYGHDMSNYQSPVSLVGIFESEQDPNEFRDRLEVYRMLGEGSQDQRDAFYVYAGMQVTVDDLFEAIVDPAAGQRLQDEYNRNVASQPLDYPTWITRATEVGLQRVAQTLTDAQRNGRLTGAVVQQVLQTHPDFARQIMDALYTGGSGDVNQAAPLSLQELLATFEYAALGSAAKAAGLELPDKARLAEMRSIGVTRAQAMQEYSIYGGKRGVFNAALQRIRGQSFTQNDFERAAFLGDATAQRDLAMGLAAEEAAGRSGGQFRFDQNRAGRLFQQGLRPV